MNATGRLVEFARAGHRLPPSARADAERLLADTLAVGAAGASLSDEAGVSAAARRWGEAQEARLLGRGGRLPAPSAAFVNGFRIHCLEWDAVHAAAVVHALSVTTAALGAAIDRRGGCDAEDALTALAVGVDVAAGLGIAATGPMRFFRPATAGVIGAALAVARIERTERFADVLGLAYSMAAGTMQAHVEGSIALPIQIAHAARAAITAVDLAGAGLSGPQDALEGPFGFFRLFEEGDPAPCVEALGTRWRISEVAVKPYPSGRASHAALSVLEEIAPDPDEVEKMEVFVPPLVERLIARPMRPDMRPAYARLCLPFLAALHLEERQIDPRNFTPEAFASRCLAALAAKVRIHADQTTDPNALEPQRVVLRLAGGKTIERRIEHTLGSPEAPLASERAGAKRDLARAVAGPGTDPRLFENPLSWFTEPQ